MADGHTRGGLDRRGESGEVIVVTVLRKLLTNKVPGRRWLLRPLRGRRLLWFVCLDLALGISLLWAGVIPTPAGTPQCVAPERDGGVDPPIVAVMEGSRDNELLVHTDRATCVIISFDLRRRPDRHRMWQFELPLDTWRSEVVAVDEDIDIAYVATAVGPGGRATDKGTLSFRASTP